MKTSERDFSFSKYERLCRSALEAGYDVSSIARYLQGKANDKLVMVVRHDVDHFPDRALRMARLENSLGIKSTYYFRKISFSRWQYIEAVAALGHEIGYHYESMDEARGDYEKAIELFRRRLEVLREIAPVETICMHGAPITPWLNRDLWKRYDFRKEGLIGEAYLSLKDIYYLSDTGRKWDPSRKFKDFLPNGASNQDPNIKDIVTTDDLIHALQKNNLNRVCLTVHPERWGHNYTTWLIDSGKDASINSVKAVLRIVKPHTIPSKV